MKSVGMFAAAALLCMCAAAQAAEVYKWVDQQGRIHFGDRPQPGWKKMEVKSTSGDGRSSSAPAGSAPPAPQTASSAACSTKRQQLESYRRATELVERNPLGEERALTEEQRTKLIQLTEQQIDQLCKPAPG